MEASTAVQKLKGLQERLLGAFNNPGRMSACIYECRATLEEVFGRDSSQVRAFDQVDIPGPPKTSEDLFNQRFLEKDAINRLRHLIRTMEEQVARSEVSVADDSGIDSSSIRAAIHLCNRFHLVCRQLKVRREKRQTLEISDEYDVQDLLRSLLKIFFDDVRPEEWSPSYAGKSSRSDFLLKKERIVIECKKTRKSLTGKEVGDELIIDSRRYATHPDCDVLICLVYDPDGLIDNPTGLESDLSGEYDGIQVIVIVNPRHS